MPLCRYLAGGRYADLLGEWLTRFPREQLLILASADFYARTQDSMAAVWEFLGLPPHASRRYRARNAAPGHAPMSASTRARLREYFEPHNERLYQLLGSRFDWDA